MIVPEKTESKSKSILTSQNASISLARVVRHVRRPLYRNAYAWLLSTGISSGLGIIYWVLAARFYALEAVGINAAIVSMMIFLAGISQLNLMSVLVRFIPSAGAKTAQLTAYSYLISSALALVTSLIFVALSTQFSSLDFFKSNFTIMSFFIPATIAWSLFTLQDSVLAGLRATLWVPVDNISYGLAKIALLILLARLMPQYGIFASWIIPAVLLLLPINALIFQRLIPFHVQRTRKFAVPIKFQQLSKYLGSNYIGSLFSLMSARLLPALVVAVAGAAAAAYFYLAWTIANSLRVLAVQMATSLTVEGAIDLKRLTVDGGKFLRNMFVLIVPMVLIVVLAAPILLRLSGEDYAAEGVTALRLLTLSVIPGLVSTWFVSMARVQNRLVEIIFAEAGFAVLFLVMSYVLLQSYGISGVGVASLISATLIAIILVVRVWMAPGGKH